MLDLVCYLWKDGMGSRLRIGLQDIRTLPPNTELWDKTVIGFGARRQLAMRWRMSCSIAWLKVAPRRYTIRRHGAPWTSETARAEARRLLSEVAKGGDPAADKKARRTEATVAGLCDIYMVEEGCARAYPCRETKKVKTIENDAMRIEAHIKPLIEGLHVASVTKSNIETFMHAVTDGEAAQKQRNGQKNDKAMGGPSAARQSVGLLGAIFTFAVNRRMRADNSVHGVIRPADRKVERRLSDSEYVKLKIALHQAAAKGIHPPAVASIWMRALSYAALAASEKQSSTGQLVFPPPRKFGKMTRAFSA